MTGHKPWKEIRSKSTATAEDRAAALRDLGQELTLAELRKARELTQEQLANALDSTQPGISRLERQTDLYLSTLRSYVRALGGELELTAVFPDAVIAIKELAELDEPAAVA